MQPCNTWTKSSLRGGEGLFQPSGPSLSLAEVGQELKAGPWRQKGKQPQEVMLTALLLAVAYMAAFL